MNNFFNLNFTNIFFSLNFQITFIILLIHQVYPFPTSSENSTETVITTETPDSSEITTTPDNIERTTKSNNSGKDDITIEEFILASVLYDDAEDDDTKTSTKVKREAPKESDKVVAKRALIFR